MEKAFVIGIAGGSASGKSTFTKKLKRVLYDLKICEVPMDSYFKSEEERAVSKAPITGKLYRDDNHPSAFDLPGLKHDLSEAIHNGHFQVVIVEGLLTLWDEEIVEQLDLRLYVDCRPDERIVRRLKRNMKWGLTFDQIADVYLDMVRYRHDEYVEPTKWRADLIINGSNPSEKGIQLIANYVRAFI